MSTDLSKIAVVREMLDAAERSVRNARAILSELVGDATIDPTAISTKAASFATDPYISSEGQRVVEGIFDGQNMIDSSGKSHPVPANYASKSKLVTGDQLKLTIGDDGRFIYKQIGPAPRKYIVGPLTYEGGVYKILAGGKAYKVLLASVTFFRAEVGDEITVIVPADGESEWAAIEAVLPKVTTVAGATEDDEETEEAKPKAKKAEKSVADAELDL